MQQTEPAMASQATVLLPIRHAPSPKLPDILKLHTVAELLSSPWMPGVRRTQLMRLCGLVT